MSRQILDIKISDIDTSENSRDSNEDLHELMESIKQNGILQPIGVQKSENGKHRVVFGNRRLGAAKKLGWKTIEATLIESIDDDVDLIIKNAVENMHRTNPTLAEQGRLFKILLKAGLNASEIGARIGMPRSAVQDTLSEFDRIPQKMHHKIAVRADKGKISVAKAASIMSTARHERLDSKQRLDLLDHAIKHELPRDKVREVATHMKMTGGSISNAIEHIKGISIRVINFPMYRKDIEEIEKKTGEPINQILFDTLASKWPTLSNNRKKKSKGFSAPKKQLVLTRKNKNQKELSV